MILALKPFFELSLFTNIVESLILLETASVFIFDEESKKVTCIVQRV